MFGPRNLYLFVCLFEDFAMKEKGNFGAENSSLVLFVQSTTKTRSDFTGSLYYPTVQCIAMGYYTLNKMVVVLHEANVIMDHGIISCR